jgi:hypothetical protein
MYPETPTKKQSVDSLLHSSIDFDQSIVFEAEVIQDAFVENYLDLNALLDAITKIKFYAKENASNAREARHLVDSL